MRTQFISFFTAILFILTCFVSCQEKAPSNMTDIDGKNYSFTTIAGQDWSTTNLTVKHYKNGDVIPQATNANEWDSLTNAGIGTWCYPGYSSILEEYYGVLYNWYAIHDTRGLAPDGWHIPSDDEWVNVKNNLGGFSFAGKKMKLIDPQPAGWECTDNSDNQSGLSAIPTGFIGDNGAYAPPYIGGFYWSSTETDSWNAIHWRLVGCDDAIYRMIVLKKYGMAIRCVRN
jgi:uncharacterized protein (TIGR02145 family)